jgi:hypothetical protein
VVDGGVLGRGRQHVLLGSGRTAPHRTAMWSRRSRRRPRPAPSRTGPACRARTPPRAPSHRTSRRSAGRSEPPARAGKPADTPPGS